MSIKVEARVGASGPTVSLPDLGLQPESFDDVHTWAGSYDVLDPSGHFVAYHTRARVPVHSYPVAPPTGYFAPLKHKYQSGEINGNFGESLPAIYALEEYGMGAGDVIHLVRTASGIGKCPDFLFRLGKALSVEPALWLPLGLPSSIPVWWPVECKATNGNVTRQWNTAVNQLIQFWFDERSNAALIPGFGLVSIFDFGADPLTMHWRFVVPGRGQTENIRTAARAASNVAEASAALRPLLRL